MMSVAVMLAMAGLLLALDLVLDGVGDGDTCRSSKERLELASVAHLVPDGAASSAADHSSHETLLAILGLSWLAVIV